MRVACYPFRWRRRRKGKSNQTKRELCRARTAGLMVATHPCRIIFALTELFGAERWAAPAPAAPHHVPLRVACDARSARKASIGEPLRLACELSTVGAATA